MLGSGFALDDSGCVIGVPTWKERDKNGGRERAINYTLYTNYTDDRWKMYIHIHA